MKQILTGLVLAASLVISSAQAGEPEVRSALLKIDPAIKIAAVDDSELPGFFEVSLETGEILFVTDDGQYIVSGRVFQVSDQGLVNLTERRMSGVRAAALADVADADMVIYPATGEKRARIWVFTDVDCPYCQKLHAEVPQLNAAGVEVAYLAFPRSGPGGNTEKRMNKIWCADDRLAAMDSAINGRDMDSAACATPVLNQLALGQQLGVNGTPAILTAEGALMPGYVPADRLLPMLGIK